MNKKECTKCDGRGFCLTCDGYGYVKKIECPECSGSGSCPECDGLGYLTNGGRINERRYHTDNL